MENTKLLKHFKNLNYQNRYMELYNETMTAWPVKYSEHYIETDYGQTYVIECGDASLPPLVMMHWFCYNSTIWKPMIKNLSSVFHVYMIDVIGDMGKSNAEHPPKNSEQLALWGSQVLDGLDLETTNLLGFSNGGFTAATIAQYFPDRFEKVILLAPAATIKAPGWNFYKSVFSTMFFPGEGRINKFIKSFSAFPERWTDSMKEMLLMPFTGGKIQVKIWPKVYSQKKLSRLTMPVLVILGEDETMYDPKKVEKRAKERIPGCNVELINQCKHSIPYDQPEEVVKLIKTFLSS